MRFLLFLLVVVCSAGAGQAENISASALLCRELAQPGAVAGADYVPGVDVRGRSVVPADLGSDNQVMPLKVVRIPVDLDLAQRFNLQLPSGVELKPTLGLLNISQDGRVDFEGQNITQAAGAYCASVGKKPFSGKTLHGQAGGDRIISNSDTNVQIENVIKGQAN